MSRLSFAPVPPGPLPLFLGEPDDLIQPQGRLRCDHAAKTVYFVPADPLKPFPQTSAASLARYSTWEIDAMMPRRQVQGIYDEIRPLLELLDREVTVRLAPGGWARSQTPQADVAFECIDEALCAEVEEVGWGFVPSAATMAFHAPKPKAIVKPAHDDIFAIPFWVNINGTRHTILVSSTEHNLIMANFGSDLVPKRVGDIIDEIASRPVPPPPPPKFGLKIPAKLSGLVASLLTPKSGFERKLTAAEQAENDRVFESIRRRAVQDLIDDGHVVTQGGVPVKGYRDQEAARQRLDYQNELAEAGGMPPRSRL